MTAPRPKTSARVRTPEDRARDSRDLGSRSTSASEYMCSGSRRSLRATPQAGRRCGSSSPRSPARCERDGRAPRRSSDPTPPRSGSAWIDFYAIRSETLWNSIRTKTRQGSGHWSGGVKGRLDARSTTTARGGARSNLPDCQLRWRSAEPRNSTKPAKPDGAIRNEAASTRYTQGIPTPGPHLDEVGGAGFDDIVARASPRLELPAFVHQIRPRRALRAQLHDPRYIIGPGAVDRATILTCSDLRELTGLGPDHRVGLVLFGKDEALERLWVRRYTLIPEIANAGYDFCVPPRRTPTTPSVPDQSFSTTPSARWSSSICSRSMV